MTHPHKLALSLLVTALAVATSARAGDHWMERPGGKAKVELPSLAPMVKELEPAVLSIFVESRVGPNLDPNDPRLEFFRRFGMNLEIPDFKQQGQGTGFLIHPDGYALTNHHVIEGAQKIQVRVGGASEMVNATVIGDDPRTDVALIKLEGDKKNWPYLPLGDSDALLVGDFVVAIGNPFGLSQSVSMGIVSAKSRRDIAPSGRKGLYDFIQTDASINPGNSGGPLLNLSGEVIGINSAINAAGQGIGFAIPMNMVKQLIPDLKKKGKVERAWIGVGIRRIEPDVAKGLGLDRARGALISQVVEGSPAFKAGLKPGDIITKFDGKGIEDSSDLPLLASTAGVGRTVPIELMRDGELRSGKVTLAPQPHDGDDDDKPSVNKPAVDQNPGKIGVRVDTLDDALRDKLDLDARQKGAVLLAVDPSGAAAQAGLEAGDVVVEINGKAIGDAKSFVKALDAVPSGKLVKMIVLKRGAKTFVAMSKP